MFADYRVPQTLEARGVLEYRQKKSQKCALCWLSLVKRTRFSIWVICMILYIDLHLREPKDVTLLMNSTRPCMIRLDFFSKKKSHTHQRLNLPKHCKPGQWRGIQRSWRRFQRLNRALTHKKFCTGSESDSERIQILSESSLRISQILCHALALPGTVVW